MGLDMITLAAAKNYTKRQVSPLVYTSYAAIREVVRQGKAQEYFRIGDQIPIRWTDWDAGVAYDIPLDVVGFDDATLQDGSVVPGMTLQWHYCTPYGVQFSQYQAFYKAKAELPAGTYNVTMGASWGTNVVAGKSYQFTLTKAVPAGGILSGFNGAPDNAPSTWKVYSWASNTATTALETVPVAEGTGGTNLGTLTPQAADGVLNSLHRTAYGNGNYEQSALRQWLNSDKGAGAWWTPQTDYDRPPDQASKKGFLCGFDPEFLAMLTPVSVKTYRNTVNEDGAAYITFDKWFPLSLEQLYVQPQIAGEGTALPYWQQVLGTEQPVAQYGTYPELRTYGAENHSVAQNVRLRSANRGLAFNTWHVTSSGSVYSNGAVYAFRAAPACVIC